MKIVAYFILLLASYSLSIEFSWEYLTWFIVGLIILIPYRDLLSYYLGKLHERK